MTGSVDTGHGHSLAVLGIDSAFSDQLLNFVRLFGDNPYAEKQTSLSRYLYTREERTLIEG